MSVLRVPWSHTNIGSPLEKENKESIQLSSTSQRGLCYSPSRVALVRQSENMSAPGHDAHIHWPRTRTCRRTHTDSCMTVSCCLCVCHMWGVTSQSVCPSPSLSACGLTVQGLPCTVGCWRPQPDPFNSLFLPSSSKRRSKQEVEREEESRLSWRTRSDGGRTAG